MLSLSRKLGVFALSAAVAALASPAGQDPSAKFATHRRHVIRRGVELEAYHVPSTFETFDGGIDLALEKRDGEPVDLEEAALAFAEQHAGITADQVAFRSGYAGQTGKFAYLRQTIDGIPVANAVANVVLNNDDKVVAFGSSFVQPSNVASRVKTISEEEAIAAAEEALGGKYNGHPITLEYYINENHDAVLTHVVQVELENGDHWYEAFVDASNGELVSLVDFVADATYLVLPITKQDPREGFETLVDPQDPLGSPEGWHGTTINTSGNNVIAYKTATTNLGLPTAENTTFVYGFSPELQPTAGTNLDAARTNAFYIVNTIHDFTYRYGFTEAAFNFQTNNFGKGGVQNDAVLVSVQDTSGTNNANFATPADGGQGRMRMYLWTRTSPQRDGSLENDIITHEMTHGITNRMTGGGTGRCLSATESGGMGEGWSDALADWTERTSDVDRDFTLGGYVTNNPAGIRTAPYSTDANVNRLRYSSIPSRSGVHQIGEIWANLLHNVYAALVLQHGFSSEAKTNPDGTEGNIVFLHLFLDALAIQPCNPTFPQARQAWITADEIRYGGANKCILWNIFASKGLGVNAANRVDSTIVPEECEALTHNQ